MVLDSGMEEGAYMSGEGGLYSGAGFMCGGRINGFYGIAQNIFSVIRIKLNNLFTNPNLLLARLLPI